MNGDSPGTSSSSSSDDLEFLGPAVSRRRAGDPESFADDGDLAGPFVGGSPVSSGSGGGEGVDEIDIPFGQAGEGDEAVPLGEAGGWEDEDLPWLLPEGDEADAGDKPDGGDGQQWRPASDVELSSGSAAGSAGIEWDGEPAAYGEIGSEAEVARQGWDEAFGAPIAWDPAFDEEGDSGEAVDVTELQVDGGVGEPEAFVADSGAVGESWSDAVKEADEPRGMTGGAEPPWEPGRWDAEQDFDEVEDEEAGAEALELPAAGEMGAGVDVGDPMVEVAERLERVAAGLRGGRPLELAVEGDPLELLIAGYALGYAQGRRGRS